MKYLIACLGNIGAEYAETRHNIGFMVADQLAGNNFAADKLAGVAEVSHRGRKLVILKPTTYMNLSGKAIAYHLQVHKIPVSNLLVVTDDIALPFGTLRLRPKGSDGGHNGLKNIQELLKTTDYARLRIGVGDDFPKGRQVDYVLGKFSSQEIKNMPFVLDAAAEAIQTFAFAGIQEAMNRFNKNVLALPGV